jgi:tetratricopeptide (TPR) repeat protein
MDNHKPGPVSTIELLLGQAMQAYGAEQYAQAESLLAEASAQADAFADLPTRVRVHCWLAEARRRQGLAEEALATYTWLIGQANDPDARAALSGRPDSFQYLCDAFVGFVAIGRLLPQMPRPELHRVIELGLAFLDEIGHREWGHSLRMERGSILVQEGRLEEARQELEAAVALRRRDTKSMGFTLGGFLLTLADVLTRLHDDEGAERCYREILEGVGHTLSERRRAAVPLAWIQLERANRCAREAEHWASEALDSARALGDAAGRFQAIEPLVAVLVARGQVAAATREAATLWHCARLLGAGWAIYRAGTQLVQVRLSAARAALGLPPNPSEPAPPATSGAAPLDAPRALRYLVAAKRWIAWSRVTAEALDARDGSDRYLRNLEALGGQIYDLRVRLR